MPTTNGLPEGFFERRLLFVGGKGGVGKTSVSRALARAHAQAGRRTLWVEFENPAHPQGQLRAAGSSLWELNCEAGAAFEEYVGIKLGVPALAKVFLQNKVTRYLAKAAPGIHELVLLGKAWFERDRYDRIVIDLPSTGYGVAMFQSTRNFARLFKGGPIHQDAEAMHETFGNPAMTGHLIVSTPEEMPLVESLELRDLLIELFPGNPPELLLNRRLPEASASLPTTPPHADPFPHSAVEYARTRNALEAENLQNWKGLSCLTLPFVPPPSGLGGEILARLTQIFRESGWVRT
jgi:anion-transporting  ArsA/GET3 family ATPase